MSAQNRVVQKTATTAKKTSSNTEKGDYMNFDSKGEYLVSFRHTCEDGSYMEVVGDHYRGNDYYYRPVTICDSEGNKYTGTFYIGSNSDQFNNIYNLNDCCKLKSYNNYLELFYESLKTYKGYDDGDKYDETFIETKDKQKKYYFSGTYIAKVLVKISEDSYILYDTWKAISSGRKFKKLDDVPLETIWERYTVYKNGSILLKYCGSDGTNYVYEADIKYDNGDKYKGKIDLDKTPIGSDSFKPGIEMPQFAFTDGAMKLNDGTIRVYVNGEIDEFESKKPSYERLFNAEERAAKAAKVLETKKKQVAQKIAGYTKKYGASSTNYLSKQGEIVKGMTLAFIREYISDFNQIGFYYPYYTREVRLKLSLQEYKPTMRDMTQFGRAVKSYKLVINDQVQLWSFLVINGKVVSSSLREANSNYCDDISMNRVIIINE
jgi:hypothetical protein